MIENSGIPCVAVRRRRRGSRFDLGFVTLCLIAAVLAGCQKEASTAKKTMAQPDGSTTQAVSTEAQKSDSAAQTGESKASSSSAPEITFKEPVVDFGEIGTDVKRTGQFHFTNTGKSPLKILQVHACCGTVIRGVEAGQEYAPGESGTLEFDCQTSSSPQASMTKKLGLRTNDPNHPIVSLLIKASVVRRVEWSPLSLRLFLKKENAGCGDVTLRSLDGQPFSISSIKSTANAIPIDYDPNVKATEFVLRPRPDMAKLPHTVRGRVSIDLTHPECRNVQILFDVLPEFTINPATLLLFDAKPDKPVERVVTILSNYVDDFEIESVSSQKGMVKLLEQEKMGNRYQLKIEVGLPPRQGDETRVGDVLNIKIKDGSTESIQILGFYSEGQ